MTIRLASDLCPDIERLGTLAEMEGSSFGSAPYSLATGEVFRIVYGAMARRRQLSVVPLAVGALACVVIGLMQDGAYWFVLAAACVLMPGLLALRLYSSCRDAARLNAAERRTTFGTEGLHQTDSLGNDTTLAWGSFLSCEDRRSYWLLYVTKLRFAIVPKSAFTESQAESVSDLLRSKGLLK